jgi:hypothetical protein
VDTLVSTKDEIKLKKNLKKLNQQEWSILSINNTSEIWVSLFPCQWGGFVVTHLTTKPN